MSMPTAINNKYRLITATTNYLLNIGDYSQMPIQTNQLIKGSGQHPLMVNSGSDRTGDIYIHHREYLGPVTASATLTASATAGVTTPGQSTFNVQSYPINAALQSVFPWLSQIARNFTFYEFEGLVFEYRPTSGEYGNLQTNALGKVIMATQYDPDAAYFPSSQQMENYDYATACKPAEHMIHGVETKIKQRLPNMLYTRTGTSTKDAVLTDLGEFQIATEGVPLSVIGGTAGATLVTVNIGELWVSYKVRLSRANINSQNIAAPTDYFLGYNGAAAAILMATSPTQLAAAGAPLTSYYPLGSPANQAVPKLTNQIGCSVVGLNATSFLVIFPPGTNNNYLIGIGSYDSVNEQNVIQPATAVAADLTLAQTNGWVPPSGSPNPAILSLDSSTGGTGTTIPQATAQSFTASKNGVAYAWVSPSSESELSGPTWLPIQVRSSPGTTAARKFTMPVTTGTIIWNVIITATTISLTA